MTVKSRLLAAVLLCMIVAPAFGQVQYPGNPADGWWLATGKQITAAEAWFKDPTQPEPTQAIEPQGTIRIVPGQSAYFGVMPLGPYRTFMMRPGDFGISGPNVSANWNGLYVGDPDVVQHAFVILHTRNEWQCSDGRHVEYGWGSPGRGYLHFTCNLDFDEPGTYTMKASVGLWLAQVTRRNGQIEEQVNTEVGPFTHTFTVVVAEPGQEPPAATEPAPTPTVTPPVNVQPSAPTPPVITLAPKPAEPQIPALTREQAWEQIRTRFVALGNGITTEGWGQWVSSPGTWNNIRSVLNGKYSDYVCGAWQSKVLDMLNGMRNGTPEEKRIFEHFDYGPIQAYYGGHQAVVIFPKGGDWRKDGIVLDPWPTQRPKTYSMKDWESRFWFGVGTSGVYAGQYPLTGASDYPKPRLKVPRAHQLILKRVTPAERDRYLALTNQPERDAFIDALPAKIKESTAIAVHSPVRMLLTDAQGRRVGWVDDSTFVYEIPGADLDCVPEGEGEHGMFVLLPKDEYQVQITGTRAGVFGFTRVHSGSVTSNPLAQTMGVPIQPGQQFTYRLSPTTPDVALQGPGGTVIQLTQLPLPSDDAAAITTLTPAPVQAAAPSISEPGAGGTIAAGAQTQTLAGRGKPGTMLIALAELVEVGTDRVITRGPTAAALIGEDGSWRTTATLPQPEQGQTGINRYYRLRARWIDGIDVSDITEVKLGIAGP